MEYTTTTFEEWANKKENWGKTLVFCEDCKAVFVDSSNCCKCGKKLIDLVDTEKNKVFSKLNKKFD